MAELKRWAAVDANGYVLAIGLTLPWRKFNRRDFHFSCSGFCRWVATGARYCEVDVSVSERDNINDIPHGRMRYSKDYPFRAKVGLEVKT